MGGEGAGKIPNISERHWLEKRRAEERRVRANWESVRKRAD